MKLRRHFLLIASCVLLLGVSSEMKADKESKALEQINLGNEAIEKRDFEGAITAFQSAVKLQKKPAQARAFLSYGYYLYGVHLATKNDFEHSVEMFQKALALGPDEAYWHAGLGTVLEKKGDREGALKEFQTASQLSPGDWGLAQKCKQLQGGDQVNGSADSKPDNAVNLAPGSKAEAKDVTPPKELVTPSPPYTEQARRAIYGGNIVLSLLIDTSGRPAQISIIKPLGMGLDQSAIKTVSTWQFEPALRDGKPVAVRLLLEVNFRLH